MEYVIIFDSCRIYEYLPLSQIHELLWRWFPHLEILEISLQTFFVFFQRRCYIHFFHPMFYYIVLIYCNFWTSRRRFFPPTPPSVLPLRSCNCLQLRSPTPKPTNEKRSIKRWEIFSYRMKILMPFFFLLELENVNWSGVFVICSARHRSLGSQAPRPSR